MPGLVRPCGTAPEKERYRAACALLNRSVETRLELAQDLPLISGDRVQRQRERGSSSSAIDCWSRMVELQIADLDKGIPEADLEGTFSRFVTSKNDGMGLGPAEYAMIVRAHRGRLWAGNNPDAVTAPYVWLPRVDACSPGSRA